MQQLIKEAMDETRFNENPYFTHLLNGQFEKDDFIETQIQFYYAVIFFSRPMAALAAKIPTPELRIEVLRNVWEEHGEGHLSHGHGNTFKAFLQRLASITVEQVNLRGLWPEIRIFNTTLAGVTVLDDFLVGVAVLGVIERMFSEISTWIGQGVVKRGWLTKANMIHYTVHQNLDIKHSEDFFNILKEPYAESDENRYRIEQGLRLGATLFNDMYFGLWRSRKRRWLLTTHISPSQTSDYVS
ncbi:MAG: iron-containing redox enzyme family protein [Gammaproteobacteria bacterium]|nr:iron-containing redox enzyme family protein [Gammaproteobacteria bacterium]